MPTTEVQLKGGNIIYVEHTDDATSDDILDYALNYEGTTDDRGSLLANAGKTFLSGGIEAAINVGAGAAQTLGMGIDILDGEMDGINPNMGDAVQTMNDVAQRWRTLSKGIDERMGIDPEFANSFAGQVLNGFGQLPVNIAGGLAGSAIGSLAGPGGTVTGGLIGSGLAIAPQMTSEAIMDAENTFGKGYTEFTDDEKDQAALSALGYTALGSALEYVGLLKSVPQLKRFLGGKLKLPSGQIKKITKSLKREIVEGFATEGFTEAAQGQLLDSLAAATYDDDRRLMSYDVLANRFNEFLIGGVVGGGAAGATGGVSKLFQSRASDENKDFTVATGANTYDVSVTDNSSGKVLSIPVTAASEQEAVTITQEQLDARSSGNPDLTFTVTGATAAQGPVEQVIEEPEVQPEAQPEVQPEVQPEAQPEVQTDLEEESLRQQAELLSGEGATEQDIQSVMSELRTEAQERQAPATPTAQPVPATTVPEPATAQPQRTGTFQLPKELRGAKPTYRGSRISFPSDFERAVYIAGNPNSKARRFKDYLSELEDAGYSVQELRQLRKEMMSDLKSEYKEGQDSITPKRLPQKDITAGASQVFTAPQKAELSHVTQNDIIDIDSLLNDIQENNIPVWFWYADQLGDGDLQLPNQKNQSITLDAGPSYALTPANKAAGRVWASSKSAKEINNKISQLEYTDKDGNKKTGYIFLVSGSPNNMFLFNKQAFMAFYKNAFGSTAFSKVKAEILANSPTKPVRDILNKYNSLKDLLDSSDSRPFIQGLTDQRGKTRSKLSQYLESKVVFALENEILRNCFYRENDFRLNDVLLVVQPTKADNKTANHGTYTTPVYGKVIGVPDKRKDAFLLLPDDVRQDKAITMEPAMAAQVVAPYGARVTNIKDIVGSEEAQRSVKYLTEIITSEDAQDGFTITTSGDAANEGYVVAPNKETETHINRDDFNAKTLTEFIISNAEYLNVKGAMLGGWYNSEDGTYVLDVVFSIDKFEDAVEIAIWGDQDAIYHLDTGTEIRTKDDTQNKTAQTPTGYTGTASEILSRKPSISLGQYSSERRRVTGGLRQAIPQAPVGPTEGLTDTDTDITVGGFLGDSVRNFLDVGLNPPVDNSMMTPQERRAEEATAPEGAERFSSQLELERAIESEFGPIIKALGLTPIFPNVIMRLAAQYNVSRNYIEYNPRLLIGQSKEYVRAAMREELIHAVTHKVIMQQGSSWVKFFGQVGRDMNAKERRVVSDVYRNLKDDYEFGAEFYRMIIQQGAYGSITEQFSKGGPAMSRIKKLLKKIQSYMARLLKTVAGEKYEADVMIQQSAALLASVDPSARPTNQKVVQQATENVDIQTGNRDITAGTAAEINTPPSKKEKSKEKLGFMDKYVNTVSRVLSKISPRIAQTFQNFFNTVESEKNDAVRRVLPFVRKYNTIKNKADKKRLKQLLLFSPLRDSELDADALFAERDALLRKYDMYNDLIFGVMPVLNRLRENAREQGIDVGFLEGFFPRRVIDIKGLKASLGRPIADDIELAIRQRNQEIDRENLERTERNAKLQPGEKGEVLLPRLLPESKEEALFIENYIRRAGTDEQFLLSRGISVKIPKEQLSRTIELINESDLDFYDDIPSGLESYITNMIVATRTVQLIGKRYQELDVESDPTFEPERTPGDLSVVISELLASGEINAEDVKTVRNIARMVLNPAAKENEILSGLRQASYISTLVEFTSTLSQLFDLPFVLYRNGLINTVRGLGMTRDFSLESFGYAKDRVSDEFTDEKSFLNSAAKFGLRAVGFTKLDQIMKESNLAASYLQMRKLARGYYKNRDSNASKKFRLEVEQYNGAENVDATIVALKKGDRNNALVRNLVFSQLLKTQPMSKMQSVAAQSANPNVRFVYQMKSFMITQLAYTRQEIFDDLFGSNKTNSQRAKAFSNLTKLMGFMLLIGLPVDALKDFLAGRLGYLDDYLFNGIFRAFGISKYQTYQIKREGIGQAALDFITPITIQQGVDYTAELQRVMSGDKALTESKLVSIAPASDVINRLFGFTREKEKKEYMRRLKQDREVPFITPPGAM